MAESNIFDQDFRREQPLPPPIEDSNARRYGISFLINIPLYKHQGNSAFINQNFISKETGAVINRAYLNRMTLFPLVALSVAVPPGAPSSRTTDSTLTPTPFNPESALDEGSMIRSITKSPAQCADQFLGDYSVNGGVIFNTLTGVETYDEALKDFYAVLPLNNKKIFPDKTRNVLNERFTSPFLDDILEYLEMETSARLQAMNIDTAKRNHLYDLYDEIMLAVRNTIDICKEQITTSEAAITSVPSGKKGYDVRDSKMFKDAPEPLDLLCLAMLDKKPMNERQLEDARLMQQVSGEPMAQAANAMVQAANAITASQNAPGLTREDIQKMVADGIAEGLATAKK